MAKLTQLVKGQQYVWTDESGVKRNVVLTMLPQDFRNKAHVRLVEGSVDGKTTHRVWPRDLSVVRGGQSKTTAVAATTTPTIAGLMPALRPVIPYVDNVDAIGSNIIGWGIILGQAVAFVEGGQLFAVRQVPEYVQPCPVCSGNGAVVVMDGHEHMSAEDTEPVIDAPDHTDADAPQDEADVEGAEVDTAVNVTYPGGEPVDDGADTDAAQAAQEPEGTDTQEPEVEQPLETAPQAATPSRTRKSGKKASKLLPTTDTPAGEGVQPDVEALANA